jgi:hypothetical protein
LITGPESVGDLLLKISPSVHQEVIPNVLGSCPTGRLTTKENKVPKINIADIAAIGPELDEGDLRLVNGGINPDRSSIVMTPEGGRWRDKDF